MDFNDLFHRHQVSVMRAASAACAESRDAHQRLAQGYAGEIGRERARRGATLAVLHG